MFRSLDGAVLFNHIPHVTLMAFESGKGAAAPGSNRAKSNAGNEFGIDFVSIFVSAGSALHEDDDTLSVPLCSGVIPQYKTLFHYF